MGPTVVMSSLGGTQTQRKRCQRRPHLSLTLTSAPDDLCDPASTCTDLKIPAAGANPEQCTLKAEARPMICI